MKDAHEWFHDIDLEKACGFVYEGPNRYKLWSCKNCALQEGGKSMPGTRKTVSRSSCKERQVRIVCES